MGNLFSGDADRNLPKGCVINMAKQDASVKYGGYRKVWIPYDFRPGPCTEDVAVLNDTANFEDPSADKGLRPTDDENNYLYEPGTPQCDAVNVFAVVHHVLTMYRRALKRMGAKPKLDNWVWGKGPLIVVPLAAEGPNAFYYKDMKMLLFLYFRSFQDKETWVYTNRSFDIAAHEVGHGILDVLQPDLLSTMDPQRRALQESFGDLTAIFAVLSQLDSIHSILITSKGDLHGDNFLYRIGEEMGLALLGEVGVRDLDKNVAMDEVTEQFHDLSRVFTGAVYDALVDMYERDLDLSRYDPAYTLLNTGKHMCEIVLAGFANAQQTDLNFMGIANRIMEAEKNEANKKILKFEFDKRKIFDPNAKPKPDPNAESAEGAEPAGFVSKCGTLNAKAMANVRRMLEEQKKMKAGGTDTK